MEVYNGRTDEELALLYMAGENSAFDELLARNQQKLFSYIMTFVGSADKANDVFQETFLKVISKLRDGQYTASGKFSYWLYRVAHNVIIDEVRKEKSGKVSEVYDGNNLNKLPADLQYSCREQEYVAHQVLTDVHRLMDALPDVQKEVVFMKYFQDCSFKEIAEATGVSINTSLGRMRYALMNMRRIARKHNISLEMSDY